MPRIYTDFTKDENGKEHWNFRDVDHINFYLLPDPDVFVKLGTIPLSRAVPKIIKGSQPTDSGNLILSEDEKNFFVEKYPQNKKFVRQFMGAEDFIHNKKTLLSLASQCYAR